MKDIEDRTDVEKMVNTFYDQVRQDELLAPIFEAAIHDWAVHLPVMYDFWDSMLFGSGTYKGNPFSKHIPLAIDEKHFNRWLDIFKQTLDNQFVGTKADEAKSRAESIAQVFVFKLGQLRQLKA
jgi:hemoglobin